MLGNTVYTGSQSTLPSTSTLKEKMSVPAIITGCPKVFEGLDSLVDVGGGNGSSLRLLVKACLWMQGINFDLPHVVSVASKCDGVEHIRGNMFESVPKADPVFLKSILHDWGIDECIQILRKYREAIPKDKERVIIIEAVIEGEEEDKLEDVRLRLDMVMLACTNEGKDRTLKEWANILGEARFN